MPLYDVMSRDHDASPWCELMVNAAGDPCGRVAQRYLMARAGSTWPWAAFSYCDRQGTRNHRARLVRALEAEGFEIIDGFHQAPLPRHPAKRMPALRAMAELNARARQTARDGIARVHRASTPRTA